MLLPTLSRKARNEDVIEFLNFVKSEDQKHIRETLLSARPDDAKVMSVLYSASPKGVVDETLMKFESSKSIIELIILGERRRALKKILNKLRKADKDLNAWRLASYTRQVHYGPILTFVSCMSDTICI